MLYVPQVVSEVSLGMSIRHFICVETLRMINSLDLSSSLNCNAQSPSRMEVNSGRSVYHSLFNPSLSNTTREHFWNEQLPNRSEFNLGMSIRHFIPSIALLSSSDDS